MCYIAGIRKAPGGVGVLQINEEGGQEGEHPRQSTSMKTLKKEGSAQSPGAERCRTESEGKMGEIRMMERAGSKRARGTEVTEAEGRAGGVALGGGQPGSGVSGTPFRGEWQCCMLGTEMLVCHCSEPTDHGERPPWGPPAQSPPLNE